MNTNTPGGVPGNRLVQISDQAHSRAHTANALFITSGVLAVSAGVMSLFTDWHGYRNAQATTAVK